jgi:lipid IVA palmitoyltransferase
VQRPDIADGIPVPVILPTGSVRYGKATVMGLFIPSLNGTLNHGNTLFLFGRYMLQ